MPKGHVAAPVDEAAHFRAERMPHLIHLARLHGRTVSVIHLQQSAFQLHSLYQTVHRR